MKTEEKKRTDFHGTLDGFHRMLKNQEPMPIDFTLRQLTEMLVDKYRDDKAVPNEEMANNLYCCLWATLMAEDGRYAFRFMNDNGKINLEIPKDCIYL